MKRIKLLFPMNTHRSMMDKTKKKTLNLIPKIKIKKMSAPLWVGRYKMLLSSIKYPLRMKQVPILLIVRPLIVHLCKVNILHHQKPNKSPRPQTLTNRHQGIKKTISQMNPTAVGNWLPTVKQIKTKWMDLFKKVIEIYFRLKASLWKQHLMLTTKKESDKYHSLKISMIIGLRATRPQSTVSLIRL